MPSRGRSRPERDARAPPIAPRRTPGLASASPRGIQPPRTRPGTEVQPAVRFAQTPDFTVGVEEELVLVDPDEGSLVERPPGIDELVAASEERLQTEIFRTTVETTTPVCADRTEMADHMRQLRARVVEAARDEGLAAAALATHPFARWETERTSPGARYQHLVEEYGLPMMSDLVFGQHVHVSVGSPEEALRVTHDIQPFLPLILAISANAPFWRGMDTGLSSARTNVSSGMPRSGLPPSFADWDELQAHLDTLRQAGAIEDLTKIYWDVRPRPDLGTVEVRIADLPTDVDTSIALAAFTHALVVHLAENARRGDPPPLPGGPLVAENRWRAMRHGIEARFIDPEADPGEGTPLRSLAATFEHAVDIMAPTIERLDVQDDVDHLRKRITTGQGGARRQRQVHGKAGNLEAVVDDAVARTPP